MPEEEGLVGFRADQQLDFVRVDVIIAWIQKINFESYLPTANWSDLRDLQRS